MSKPCAADLQALSSENFSQDKISQYARSQTMNGARSLNAIWRNSSFGVYERCFLNALGHTLNFNGDFMESISLAMCQIAEFMGCSVRKAQQVAHDLEEKGYIKIQRRTDGSGNPLPNLYRLTQKIFDEEHERLTLLYSLRHKSKTGNTPPPGAQCAPPGARGAYSSPSSPPNKNSLSSKESETSVSPPEERKEDSLEGEDKEVKKTEEEKAADVIAQDLKEHGYSVKLKDVVLLVKETCKKKDCTPEDLISLKEDALLYIVARRETGKSALWEYRNWVKFAFPGKKTPEGPKIPPINPVTNAVTPQPAKKNYIDADELIAQLDAPKTLTPEEIAEKERFTKELRAKADAARALLGKGRRTA